MSKCIYKRELFEFCQLCSYLQATIRFSTQTSPLTHYISHSGMNRLVTNNLFPLITLGKTSLKYILPT